jgi:hypothetical protein
LNFITGNIEKDIALIQHHDAITGTSPDKTIEDYLMTLDQSKDVFYKVFFSIFSIFFIDN